MDSKTLILLVLAGGGVYLATRPRTTANGNGNLFYDMVERARKGVGRFAFRFLDWRARRRK